MLGKPLYEFIRKSSGWKLTGSSRSLDRHRLVLRDRDPPPYGVVGRFVEYFGPGLTRLGSPTGRRSRTWLLSMARRRASGRSTRDRSNTAPHGPHEGSVALAEATEGRRLSHDRTTSRYSTGPRLISDRRAKHRRPRARRIACPFAGQGIARLPLAGFEIDGAPSTTRRWPTASLRPTRQRGRPASRGCRSPAAEAAPARTSVIVELDGERTKLDHGSVAIAAITSCTNTSNPSGAGQGRSARQERSRARPGSSTPMSSRVSRPDLGS